MCDGPASSAARRRPRQRDAKRSEPNGSLPGKSSVLPSRQFAGSIDAARCAATVDSWLNVRRRDPHVSEMIPASFADLGLAPALMRGVADLGFTTATPIQAKAVPPALLGRDVLACAM